MEAQTRRLRERLRRLLRQQFPGAELDSLGVGGPYERIGGVVVWRGFEGVAGPDRQRALWDVLRGRLGRDDLLHISVIMTLTPRERDAMKSNSRL